MVYSLKSGDPNLDKIFCKCCNRKNLQFRKRKSKCKRCKRYCNKKYCFFLSGMDNTWFKYYD